MTPDEKRLIDDLFARLDEAGRALPPHEVDGEADRAIRDAFQRRPMAGYLMVQNAVVLEHALRDAQARIAELERGARPAAQPASGGGIFARLGGPWAKATTPATSSPWGRPAPSTPPGLPRERSSFMRTALMTAAGVAGGMLLFQGLSSLLDSGQAHAAPPPPPAPEPEPEPADDFGGFDGGGFDGGGSE
jgi:hypothetical protein